MTTEAPLPFRALIHGLREGDEQAARQVVDQYTVRLVAVARQQIGGRLQQRIDAEDVILSAYRSLFCRLQDGQYELGTGTDLWKLLVTLTLNKVRRKAKFHHAARRNVQIEQHDSLRLERLQYNEPTPADAIELIDLLQHFMANISDRERVVLELRLQGLTTQEISQQTGRGQRTVRRILQRLRERLELLTNE